MHDHPLHPSGASRGHIHEGMRKPGSAAPEEPGYPVHPELDQAPSARTGHEAHGAHDMHGDPDTHSGHDKHAGHSVAMFRDRFWLSFALTIPTLIWGHMLPRLLLTRRPGAGTRLGDRRYGGARGPSPAQVRFGGAVDAGRAGDAR
jgi:Cu2+-exporting ATPase